MNDNDRRVRDMLAGTMRHGTNADVILRDYIVIPKTDLPEVVTDDEGIHAGGATLTGTPRPGDLQSARRGALEHLAIAEHLAAHPLPPVRRRAPETGDDQ